MSSIEFDDDDKNKDDEEEEDKDEDEDNALNEVSKEVEAYKDVHCFWEEEEEDDEDKDEDDDNALNEVSEEVEEDKDVHCFWGVFSHLSNVPISFLLNCDIFYNFWIVNNLNNSI